MAEWLRRLTRNQMGYARTGSNPVHDDDSFFFFIFGITMAAFFYLVPNIFSFHT